MWPPPDYPSFWEGFKSEVALALVMLISSAILALGFGGCMLSDRDDSLVTRIITVAEISVRDRAFVLRSEENQIFFAFTKLLPGLGAVKAGDVITVKFRPSEKSEPERIRIVGFSKM